MFGFHPISDVPPSSMVDNSASFSITTAPQPMLSKGVGKVVSFVAAVVIAATAVYRQASALRAWFSRSDLSGQI